MRIIGGEFKRRRLQSLPQGAPTRPLPDRVRESMFNLLRGHFEDAAVFDGFAGTGSFGLEAASRGASRVVMVERDRRVARVLQANVDALGIGDRVEVVIGDAIGPAALSRCPSPANIIFLDPPYDLVRDPAGWSRVRTQAQRLFTGLTDTGYGLLRTPWPFTREETPPGGAPEIEEVIEIDLSDSEVVVDEALDRFEEALRTDRPSRPVDIDLRLEGTLGPETHVYRQTAVHLYMKAPADAE